MTIERKKNWPFPEGINSWDKLQEYLELHYIAHTEEAALIIEETETQRQQGGNYFELDENEDVMPKVKDYVFDPLWDFDANGDIQPQV